MEKHLCRMKVYRWKIGCCELKQWPIGFHRLNGKIEQVTHGKELCYHSHSHLWERLHCLQLAESGRTIPLEHCRCDFTLWVWQSLGGKTTNPHHALCMEKLTKCFIVELPEAPNSDWSHAFLVEALIGFQELWTLDYLLKLNSCIFVASLQILDQVTSFLRS